MTHLEAKEQCPFNRAAMFILFHLNTPKAADLLMQGAWSVSGNAAFVAPLPH